ncbi:MAG: hypothetical protein CVU40_10020 [Chloroflexi bacterium HGW-Chloroflexi-2]|nr:MAG: hypothetical protein CVU40_10020 [Chloroflexi bacterium HGW-Chloroflexi-2]
MMERRWFFIREFVILFVDGNYSARWQFGGCYPRWGMLSPVGDAIPGGGCYFRSMLFRKESDRI